MKKTRWLSRQSVVTTGAIVVIAGIVIVITGIKVLYSIPGSGFGENKTVITTEKRNQQGAIVETSTSTTVQDAKTLWDLLQLSGTLAIPFLIAILTYQLQQRDQKRIRDQAEADKKRIEEQAKTEESKVQLEKQRAEEQSKLEKEIAESYQREEVLQHYFDHISELLIDKQVLATVVELQDLGIYQDRSSNGMDKSLINKLELVNAATNVIRARTLAILRRLEQDGERKGDVIRFLIDSEVVKKLKLDLCDVDLSEANLVKVNLSGFTLARAILTNANLRGAVLTNHVELGWATLVNVDLTDGVFQEVFLQGANLSSATLNNAKFNTVDFNNADLSKAKLAGAVFCDAYITAAKLDDAILAYADLSDVKNWSDEQISRAKLCRTKLPEGCNLDPNGDCAELGIDPNRDCAELGIF